MPYPDFRALCAELLAEVRSLNDILGQEAQADLTLLPRADAALAQPAPEPPEPPTDKELDLMFGNTFNPLDRTYDLRAYARAVLARWGHGNG